MYKRLPNILDSNSFFLFGARGTGKSSLLRSLFADQSTMWIDLLQPEAEANYLDRPSLLSEQLSQLNVLPDWVVIDEVQKVPKLLDVVHLEIEKRKIKFALTGSSARKLKRGGANLLAGRAFLNHLYPLTFRELGGDFNLIDTLSWGSLPKLYSLENTLEKSEFLKSYVNIYLKEEILQEQLIRNATPFRKFLPIAAQMNGRILNYNAVAKDLGVDWTTVKNYFEILEDTWLGFILPAYSRSLRKQQLKASKFYLFDIGVQRVLDRTITVPPTTGQMIGPLFEHFIVLEMHRLNDYLRKNYQFSFIATQGGLEVDLVIERPGLSTLLIEIKASTRVRDEHLRHLQSLNADYPEFELFCICREETARKVGNISIMPWQESFKEIGLG
jgi:predicted AAA+ superfamily ATPase